MRCVARDDSHSTAPADALVPRSFVEWLAIRSAWQLVVVDVEATCETKALVEWKGRDERGCRKPCLLQDGRQRRHRRGHREAVVAGAVAGRITSREQAGVRRQGNRRGRKRLCKTNAFACHPVDGRRPRRHVSVGAHSIRAESVDGDEDEMLRACRFA